MGQPEPFILWHNNMELVRKKIVKLETNNVLLKKRVMWLIR